ncbi:MAG: nitroreductase [Crocinitomicaceae bacterium]|jgi:nitroreductase|nr:nitroreductase [Crocinitomicaceae bacterium]
MHPIITDLNWRYAVKKYNPDKKIPVAELEILKESIRLSPSSMGLQAYQILDIQSPEMRRKLFEASHNQSQILDASHVFVFCNMTEIPESYIDSQIENMSKTREMSSGSLSGYRAALINSIQKREAEKRRAWTNKQTYIALGSLIHTAARLRIDATPIEGFENDLFNEILGLEKLGLSSTVVCALGYRSDEDKYQHLRKVRKPVENLFIEI